MNMYYSVDELEVLAIAAKSVPNFVQLANDCAWRLHRYERIESEESAYYQEHQSGRPTKEGMRLRARGSRSYGEFWATLKALQMIAEGFGTIHTGTIHDEIMELADGTDTIVRRRALLAMANAR